MTIDFTNSMKDKTAYLSIAEINHMLQHCYDKNRIRDYMLILTLIRTGRRVTEVLGEKPYTRKVGFRPKDIMPDGLIEFDILKKNHIKLRSPKTGKLRNEELVNKARLKKMPKRKLCPVDPEYYNLIKEYIKSNNIRPHDRVFPITRQRFDIILKEIAKALHITRPNHGISAHMLRHSLSVNFLKDNPNDAGAIRQLSDILDHSNISVTLNTYAQFTQEDKIEKLDKLFNSEE